jgi:NADPH-dependent curcumin reductase CurA
VHCGECPRSYYEPRKFNSGNPNTRSRSNACSVSYVQEVEVGTVFTCEMFGQICTARKKPIVE